MKKTNPHYLSTMARLYDTLEDLDLTHDQILKIMERVEALIDERDKAVRAINESLAMEEEYENIDGLLVAGADNDGQD